jgi:hypothetical protein
MTGPATLGLDGRLAFTITVPESWYEIDLHPATRDRSIRVLVEERVRGNQPMWEQRQAIIRLLRQQARSAWEAGAAYCACFAIPTDDGPVTGSVTVSLVRGPAGGMLEDDRTDQLAGLFHSTPRTGELEPFSTVTEVQIPTVGACARSYGIEDMTLDDDRGIIRAVFMQTAAPVPGSNKVFLVSASSPVVVLAGELHDLFDAVTGTFRLVQRAAAPDADAGT